MGQKRIDDRQALHAIEHGEFPPEVIASADHVVVVLTQDWCPQWAAMKPWIDDPREAGDVAVFVFVYNTSSLFQEFMRFKETVWGNRQIPYLRYYRQGRLARESNYVSRDTFREYTASS